MLCCYIHQIAEENAENMLPVRHRRRRNSKNQFRYFLLNFSLMMVVLFNLWNLLPLILNRDSIDDVSPIPRGDAVVLEAHPLYPTNHLPLLVDAVDDVESPASLPHIYWINLDSSPDRRTAMESMFSSIQVEAVNHTRISAYNVPQTKELIEKQRFVVKNGITLENRGGEQSNVKHRRKAYEFEEAACLLSHFETIHQAYQDGVPMALILEDDSHLPSEFVQHFERYMELAPLDWKVVQLATNNPTVVRTGVNLLDPFVSWFGDHWSTRAYAINRLGMEAILQAVHSTTQSMENVWTLSGKPMLVADEVIYALAKDTYTSTWLWVDSSNFASTIQTKNAHTNLAKLGVSPTTSIASNLERTATQKSAESLLVVMNVRLQSVDEIAEEAQRIQQDYAAVCHFHEVCEWEIQAVLTDAALLEPWKLATAQLAKNIHFHLKISARPFNKFEHVRTVVAEMADYDLVLFKDNDQRLAGFPWITFLTGKANAVIAGPLRVAPEETMLRSFYKPKRQWFGFHDAQAWVEEWHVKWATEMFIHSTPVELPFLEMYFVLMDGQFSYDFFNQVLTKQFLNQTSCWGPDVMWCPAAKDAFPQRPSCHLVPVISIHEDTRQITKDAVNSTKDMSKHVSTGLDMLDKFHENAEFDRWMQTSSKWKDLVGGTALTQIEKKCRHAMKTPMGRTFDLGTCARDLTMQGAPNITTVKGVYNKPQDGKSKEQRLASLKVVQKLSHGTANKRLPARHQAGASRNSRTTSAITKERLEKLKQRIAQRTEQTKRLGTP